VPLTDGMALTLLGTLWVGHAMAHAIMLRELPHGDGIVIDILVGTFIGDTAAYLGGRAFGTRPLALKVSPNKTLEGLGFGILGAIVAVWCAGLYQDWLAGWDALLLGAVVGLAAPVGDLFESKVKRDAGLKDAGTLFGPHGGALDRLDAALFTLVAGYYVWLVLL
jgi:phosphatidate cytidylyltransferase